MNARDDALERMRAIASHHGLTDAFPDEVHAEVEAILAAPGIDAPDLADRTALPFVTIDGAGTRDLDQAMFLEADGDDLVVHYAIADASHFVRPGTALFAEALKRGASYYLPGLAIPMLPRALSEGVVSLNEGQHRRAVVFETRLDRDGRVKTTRLVRARIRSRAKLSFGEVQRFLDDPERHPLRAPEASQSVALLPVVGGLRLADAERREVVAYQRLETEIRLDGERVAFVFELGGRTEVERYNEQLSLLCNVEGARFLRDGAARQPPDRRVALLQPIYRVHPEPSEARYAALERLIAGIVERQRLDPKRWRWRRGESLADYLAALPSDSETRRIASAIHRQAVLINVRSSYALEPAPHHGVGAEVYGRFSAPMREIVGVFLHKEALELVDGGPGGADDEALRLAIVDRANEAKTLQKRIDKDVNRIAIDALFARDRAGGTPWRRGTVMGMTRGKVHVMLDEPPIEVKVYTRDLERGAPITLADDEAALLRGRDEVCRIGDEVEVKVRGQDRNRWALSLRRR